MQLSIVIPTLNESSHIVETLLPLQPFRSAGIELILVDGGSEDTTRELASGLVDHLAVSDKGRAVQMNAGAVAAKGDWLLFLHADTTLEPASLQAMLKSVAETRYLWGRFDLRLSGTETIFRLIERCINWRARLTSIATGDQGLFVRRDSFERLGGYPQQPLMEDVILCKQLKKLGKPLHIAQPVITSSRRWQERGVVRTILLMWWLRLLFFCGVSPQTLARHYYPGHRFSEPVQDE